MVLRHHLEQGLTKAAITRKLGVSRRTVLRYEKSSTKVPRYGPRRPRPSKLDPFKEYLKARIEVYPELSVVRLLSEVRALGYTGGRTVLGDYLRSARPAAPLLIEQRFEAGPGEQAQADFAVFNTGFGRVYSVLVVISWSRWLYVRFGMHQDQLSLMGGLDRAFASFGGVPGTVLFDRMRAVVIASAPDGSAVFNTEMLRFASHYGFKLRACRPCRAKTKAMVERTVSYLRSSFFYGRTFRDLEDLNAQLCAWLSKTANRRVHATTGKVPGERLEEAHKRRLRLATPTVPEGVRSRDVEVRATPGGYACTPGRLVAGHRVIEGRGEYRLEPSHRGGVQAGDAPLPTHSSSPELEFIEVEKRPLKVYERVLT